MNWEPRDHHSLSHENSKKEKYHTNESEDLAATWTIKKYHFTLQTVRTLLYMEYDILEHYPGKKKELPETIPRNQRTPIGNKTSTTWRNLLPIIHQTEEMNLDNGDVGY